jgi:2-polyprenyl-3-methyl-5-hydroxy-6-metoxy-1,4-benzoquinol methylase
VAENAFEAYATAASHLIERFESVSATELYAPVAGLLPKQTTTIVDIGAGTGRDAAWLADQGHEVLAVEPVDALRHAGISLHANSRITWLSDHLPELSSLKTRQRHYDCLLLSAVWHHVAYDERDTAFRSLGELTVPGGTVIMSLRHGPTDPTRSLYEPRVQATIDAAQQRGFRLIRECDAPSIQSANQVAGVHWTWLAFDKP